MYYKVLGVGDKAVNAEDQTIFYDGEEPAYRRNKATNAQRERKKERHKEYNYIQEMQQLPK